MQAKLIAGNWKMNGSINDVEQLLLQLLEQCPASDDVEWLVCPPFPYLAQAAHLLKGSSLQLGAQNVCQHQQGAFTGEVSADMLLELGCRYAIIGHSERRQLYGESNELVAQRFKRALMSGLHAILCVGETLEQREAGQTDSVIADQLATALQQIDAEYLTNLVVAYEPIWAIGTGKTATAEQAQAVHKKIRLQLQKFDANFGESVRILYGGSVKPENAAEMLAMDEIDGALIGGASLKAEQFSAIGQICNS